jgi:hypothetical protein
MRSKKYFTKASAPAGVWARAAAGMLGSVLVLIVAVGEAEGVEAVVGGGLAVLEDAASGWLSPAHPVSNIDTASGTASTPAENFFTRLPASLSLQRRCEPSAGVTPLGYLGHPLREGSPNTIPT